MNAILLFINDSSLTDEEFDSLPVGLVQEYNKANYEALKTILQERDSVSGQLSKLKDYFTAKGVDLSGATATTPVSNILIGGSLCD